MSEDFDKFLRECLLGAENIFISEQQSVNTAEINAAENRINSNLPDSYKFFLLNYGSGTWYDESILNPSELYNFDSDCLEMEGFVALVENVRGIGDYIAFNPTDSEVAGERPVYYCSHELLDYDKIADSFEDWLRKTFKADKQDVDLYERVFQ